MSLLLEWTTGRTCGGAVLSCSVVSELFAALWTVVHPASVHGILSMAFRARISGVGCHFYPRNLPTQGVQLSVPALADGYLPLSATCGEAE